MNNKQEKLISLLCAVLPGGEWKIFLFGSRAKQTNKKNADWDVALHGNRVLTIREMRIMRNAVEDEFTEHVDIVEYTTVSSGFQQILAKEAYVLKEVVK